jgi:OPA family glycerol-3-phosphate transporter-like MFS transporter
VFFVPAAVLAVFTVLDFFIICDTPGDTGHPDFDTADASSHESPGARAGVWTVLGQMLRHPTIIVILLIEFCSGFMRNAIMQWYPKFAKSTGINETFVAHNWGMLLCVAGITGGMVAGVISDKVFDARRGPVSGVLYAGMTVGALASLFLINSSLLGWTVIFMSLCVIGVHGMLSGTATMDFGGKRNAGVVVGIVDGAVYAGTAVQSLVVGGLIPSGDAAKDPNNWSHWPMALVPLSVVGLALTTRVWNARPQTKVATPNTSVAASTVTTPRTGTEG